MGKRGPLPKSRTLKFISGSKRAGRVGEVPMPPRGILSCPTWLSPLAKVEWRRAGRELDDAGLLARTDRAAMAGYCQAWAELQEATRLLDKEGRVLTLPNG